MQNLALFTTSWDDGHPLDLRMADLLSKHGFQGTFYVPLTNREGLPVLSTDNLRVLDQGFEMGSHTIDHCYLQSVSSTEALRQIVGGKNQLEEVLGHTVEGFCYPGGEYKKNHIKMVADAGFEYARTVVNFQTGFVTDSFHMPTTLQFYPHSRNVFMRNFIKHMGWVQRNPAFILAMVNGDLESCLKAMLNYVCENGGVFHIWGHSWELDGFDGWVKLDNFLRYAAERISLAQRLNNLDVAKLSFLARA